MRKALFLLTLFAILSFLPIGTYAHPGGTDSRGGHNDRSSGEYHYHHGYSAHSHTDIDGDGNLDCPYEFNNTTRYHSNNNQSSIDHNYYQSPDISKETIDPNWSDGESIEKKESPFSKVFSENNNNVNHYSFSLWNIPMYIIGFSIVIMFLSQFMLLVNNRIAEAMMSIAFKMLFGGLPFFILSMFFV